MSQEAEIMFEMEQQHRHELFLARVRNKTQEFYLRYRKQFETMIAQDYSDYIPNEMRRFEQDLKTIAELLESDPEAAREVSFEVGSYVHSLRALGEEARKTFQETERLERARKKMERAEKQNALMSHYYDVLSEWDSITGNFAENELKDVECAISSGAVSEVAELDARLQSIFSNANRAAAQWKEHKSTEQSRQVLVAQIEEQKQAVQAEKFEDKIKAQALLNKLEAVRRRADAGTVSTEDAQKEISAVATETDETLTDENVRREMVKAIFKWFNEHDFNVSKPRLVEGCVVLTAQRPSGNRAQFRLDANNKMFYRLDGYEGQSCLKDITAAKADWESVYGLELSNEVVKWQNPDRILRKNTQTFSSRGGNM